MTTPMPTYTFKVYFWSVDLIIVHQARLKADTESSFGWFVGIKSFNGTGGSLSSPVDLWEQKLFYGFKELTRQMRGRFPFDMNITSGNNTVDVSLGPYDQNITIFYLYFNSKYFNCYNESFWNSTLLACQSCLAGQYVNNTGSCINCSTLDPYCSECTQGQCLNCTHPYQLNTSDLCFLC
jgi:hypothetical protein